jgi:hypothetical protein
MKRFASISAALLTVAMISVTAQAATVVTGGRCTQKQLSNKLTSCETSEFTNKAGQTGYKCTCSDRKVTLNPGVDPGLKQAVPATKQLLQQN